MRLLTVLKKNIDITSRPSSNLPNETALLEDGRYGSSSSDSQAEYKKEVLLALTQVILSAGIFGATAYVRPENTQGIEMLAQQFTLWTNAVLGANGFAQLLRITTRSEAFFFKTLDHLSRQMQGTLLLATAFLLGVMMLSEKLFDVVSTKKNSLNIPLAVIQHVPSFFLTILHAVLKDERPSNVYLKPSLPFFLIRCSYMLTYMLIDGLTGISGYGLWTYNQRHHFNGPEFGFMLSAFVVFAVAANVVAYGFWRALESVKECIAAPIEHCFFKYHQQTVMNQSMIIFPESFQVSTSPVSPGSAI